MGNIVPFDSGTLPAYITNGVVDAGDLTTGVGVSYPIISIKGKVFHKVQGEDRVLITKPGDDEPAASIEVLILKANPALAKVYYENGYEEGSAEKPTCYSNDGVAPAADAAEPQAKKCATCPHNQWGSRVTDKGGKGKNCSDSRRIAIAAPGHINEPMLLRVPAASLKTLAQFGDMLKKRGVPNYSAVVTKIGFDYTVAHPALTFKPVGFIDEAAAHEAVEMAKSDLVAQIVGLTGDTAVAAPAQDEAVPAKVEKPKAEKSAAKPAKSAGLTAAVAAAETAPKVEVKVEAEPVVVSGNLQDEIANALGAINFDD